MESFVEIQNWGFNALILSALMTVVFSIFQCYGFVMQGRKIFKEKSVEAISPAMFFLFLFYFIAFAYYGVEKRSLAMTLNGLLFIPVIPIVFGIFKFKDKIVFTDIILFVLTMMIVPAMVLIENKDILLSLLLVINLGALVSQLLAIIKNKGAGAVEIKFIIIFTVTSFFWLIYAIGIQNYPLICFNSAALVVYLIIILLYRKYLPKK